MLQAHLPAQAETLYWPVDQICEQGSIDWTDVSAAGQKQRELEAPVVVLELLPAPGGHSHQIFHRRTP